MNKIVNYFIREGGYCISGVCMGITNTAYICSISNENCSLVWPLVGYFMGPFVLAPIVATWVAGRNR